MANRETFPPSPSRVSTQIIPLPRPFDPELTLSRLRLSSYAAPYYFTGPGTVRRILTLAGEPVLVEFNFAELKDALRVTVIGPYVDADGPSFGALLRETALHMWSLEHDLATAQGTLAADPRMALLVERYGGLRVACVPGPYEALLVAIIGQQISVRAAHSIRVRLMEAIGDRLVIEGVEYLSYPTPSRLLEAGADELRALGVSRTKSLFLLEVARRAESGGLEHEAFAGFSDEEAIARLTEIRGVGRWTAEVVLMRGLGCTDAFPAADLGLMDAARRLLAQLERPTERQLRALAEQWRPWRSYAALYLWASLREA